VRGLNRGRGGQRGVDALGGVLVVARDLEGQQCRAPVPGDLAGGAGAEGGDDVLDVRDLAQAAGELGGSLLQLGVGVRA
jgi:hypothetical protein